MNGPSGQLTALGTLGANSGFLINANELTVNESFWAVDRDGSMSDVLNFAGGAPTGIGSVANFLAVNSSPRTITNSIATTLGTLRFASSNSYVLAGTGTLTLSSTVGNARIQVLAGNHTLSAPVAITSPLDVDVSATAAISIQHPMNSTQTIRKMGDGLLSTRSVHANRLVVAGGLMRIEPLATPGSHAGTSRISSLDLSAGAIDLTNNALVLDYSGATPVASIQAMLISGRNNGNWNGDGLNSSSAATYPTFASLGFAEASDLFATFPAIFAGESVDASTILIRYTLAADANLDASVDSLDFGVLVSHFGESSAHWSFGDFDYNQRVDTLDFNRLAGLFGATLPPGTTPQATSAVVPEPSAAVIVIALQSGMQRRTRSRSSLA